MVLEIINQVIGVQLILIVTAVFTIIYQCVIRNWSFFNDKGIKFIRGIPFLGVHYKMILGKEAFSTSFQNCYNKYPNEKFIGMYELIGTPVYLIRDPELIKKVTITDFDHFVNHQFQIDTSADSLFGRSLFFMTDQRWKDMRSTLSPAFTGRKMRLMLSLMIDTATEFCDNLQLDIEQNPNKTYDMKDLFTRYSCDTIASCAFGLNMNSQKDRDNHFYKTGVDISNFGGVQTIKFLAYGSIPKIMKFFNVTIFRKNDSDFFRKLVKDNINYREKNNIFRPDMIQLLIEAKKGTLVHSEGYEDDEDIGFATVQESSVGKSSRKLQKWDDDDLTAQCMIFFLAGFSGISTTTCFVCYELSLNNDIQKKLYEEISNVNKQLQGNRLTYEILQKMKYMDMIVSETLRRWSLNLSNDRLVNKPYILENYDGTEVQLNVGDRIWIPTVALHMDPNYYPNPEKFDPERFNDENKANIQTGTYLPFGMGPRNCIASRFALMNCKAILFYMLSNFHIDRCEKTEYPLILKKRSTNMDAENGFWSKMRVRGKNQ